MKQGLVRALAFTVLAALVLVTSCNAMIGSSPETPVPGEVIR